MRKKQSLISQFLGDKLLIFITGLDSDMVSEEGIMSVPMINEGVLIDVDDQFILLGDESNGGFTLININNIAKIDTIQENQEELINKPNRDGMN